VLDISAAGRAGRKFFDTLLRVSWSELRAADAWRAPAGRYLAGEPLFLGDPAEDAAVAAGARASRGALLVPIYDGARDNSAFALFDAFDLAAGPRATLGLEAPIHLAFHSVFVREPAHA
jgi:carotenoid cleavage dioxygenase-like enzyme